MAEDLICSKINPPKKGLYQGAFLGDNISTYKVSAFEQMSGTDLDISLKFMAFKTGLYFPTREANAAAKNGGTIFVKLEPWSWKGKNDRSYRLQNIVKGRYDYLLKRFAKGAKKFGKPIFVSFAHEMNGNWYPWSGDPNLYIKAWRHVHKVISKIACNVTWVWNPNVDFPMNQHYPGKQYVDWVAIDGYNKIKGNPVFPVSSVFTNSLSYLKTLGKPMMIGEFACSRDNTTCLTGFIDFVTNPRNNVKAFIYFNEDKEEKWEIRTGAERQTYRSSIKKYLRLFKDRIQPGFAPSLTPTPPPGPAPIPIKPRTLPPPIFGVPDSELGKTDAYGRPQLNRTKVEARTSLKQLEKILYAIASLPANRVLDPDIHLVSTNELIKHYPELATIKQIDKNNKYKLYSYLRDFRTYWDNTILLFSVYVQKITESTSPDKQDKLARALKMAKTFKLRVDQQYSADQATGKSRAPSGYNMAALKLTQSELHAQIENRDEHFYETGIELAISAIQEFRAVELDTLHPSKPDYYSIIKGIVILGDLYNRLSNLTQDQADYRTAAYLYNKVVDLDQRGDSMFSLDLPEHNLSLNIYSQDIEDGLDFNIDQRYITVDDKRLALVGIYHQLRGIALLKSAAFYAARPAFKDINDIINQFASSIYGMIELRDAAAMADLPDIKNRFFYTQAKIVQGELLMLLADRVNYYHNGLGRPVIPEPTALLDALAAAKVSFPELDRFKALSNEIPVLEANQLIKIARNYYFTGIPRYYRYLYAQSVVKELEIAIRNGEFVHVTKVGKRSSRLVVDAEALLAFCAKHRPRIEALARDKIIPEYIKIEFDYLEAILQLTGVAPKYKNGKYKFTRVRYYNPLRTIQLIEQVKANTPMIPDVSGVPLEINATLKEAAVFIQIKQDWRQRHLRKHPTVLGRILKKSGKKMKLAEYALWLLRRVEKRTAPILPPYLMYNANITLRKHLQKKNFYITRKITRVIKMFIEDNVKVYHPSSYKEIRTKFRALKLQIRRRNKTESLAALDVFIKAINKLDAHSRSFVASYAEINAWDMETLRAELYHTMATVYGILRKGHRIQQYVQSAYMAAARSSSLYDQEHRPAFILESTNIGEDTDIPILKLSVERRERRLRELGRQR